MALGEGGIDSQIQDRMDTYRGNPKALQKAYGIGKQTIDLLALQKLNTERKQAAAAMQATQQQQPGTIAEQREAEALELIKGEMNGTLGELTGRTAGTLNQKQKQQQQNMQRMAKGASGPPAGIAGLPGLSGRPQARPAMPPQAQGLAGARMAQAATQPGGPRRMAQGGIVGFAGEDGNNQVKSPFGRLIEPLVKPFTEESLETQKLRRRVAQKFGAYGGVGKGLFARQTPEAREYATSVLNNLQSLDNAALLELEAVNFDPMVTDLSALPVLPTDGDPPVDPSVDPSVDPTVDPSVDDDLDITNIGNVGREPTDFFANIDMEYDPAPVPEADKSKLEAATAAMTAGAKNVPTRRTVGDLEGAPLEFVEAPYDAAGKEILGELSSQFRTDAKGDPISSLDAARKSSDIYEGRADKAATYDQQEADLRALQSETLDPDRMAKLARMQTLAGGRFGSGGIGSEYVKAELAKDKRRNTGLEGIRSIQDTGVNVDQVASGRGQVAGENAATRTENRRTTGLSGMRGLLDDQDRRAEQGQVEANKINIANFSYQTAISENDFKAAAGAIRDQNSAFRTIVEFEQDTIDNTVKINLQNTEEENEARRFRIEKQLEVAVKKQDQEHANNALLMNSETELTKILEEREKNVREVVALAMADDPLAMEINSKLAKLAQEGETGPQVEKLVAELNALKEQFTLTLIETVDGFGSNFARMTALRRRIAQLQGANSMLGGTLSSNDDDISMDELPTVP
tara:strand:- start:204 stop:2441 length:2238 start_codon:yes stop_codon:yes gene_type:complete